MNQTTLKEPLEPSVVIPEFRKQRQRQRQEHLKFEVSLDYIGSSRSGRATYRNPISENQREERKNNERVKEREKKKGKGKKEREERRGKGRKRRKEEKELLALRS
jgi:hypothetical protein